ncbi:MAG: hypothetical protein JOZ96_14165 [Acidobacteria bacterium]|nr:hypothetical protein [Acidobacteriota bacterium]
MKRVHIFLAATLLAAAFLLTLTLPTAFAASKTWTGGGGDGLWTTAANWSGGTVPGSSDDVILDNTNVGGSYTVTLNAGAAQTVRSVQVGYSGNANTITLAVSGAQLNVLTLNGGGATAIHVTTGGVLSNQSTSGTRGILLSTASDVFKMSGSGRYIHVTTTTGSAIPERTSGTTSANYDFAATSVFENQSGNAASFDARPSYGTYQYNKNATNSANTSLTILGDLQVSQGTLNVNAGTASTFNISGNVAISSGATFAGSAGTATATVNITGDVTGAGTFQGSTSAGTVTNITVGGSVTSNIAFNNQTTAVTFSGGAASVSFTPANSNPTVKNVNVASGKTVTLGSAITQGAGTTFAVASGGVFATGVGYTNNGTLSVGGTFQINTGGFISGTAPTYNGGSTLRYSTGGSYGVGVEWGTGTSGTGVPQNVQLSASGTNLNFGSAAAARTALGNVTLDSGTTLTLSTASGGDLKVGGNWTDGGTLVPNSRAVYFNGAGTQTVARGSAGTETFAYLVVDKAGGDLTFSGSPATSVVVNSPGGGSALQIVNEGGIDLGGNGLTLSGSVAGTNVLVGGATASATRNVAGTGTFNVTGGAKSVTNNNAKRLAFGAGVNVSLFQSLDFGAGLSTVNGTLTLGSGGSVGTNAPTYGSSSTLLYDCVCVYGRSNEWSATSGAGYPNNVQVNSGTDVDLGNGGTGTARQLAGSLNVNSGGRLLMVNDANANAMTAALTVTGSVNIGGGTLRLSSASGGDLKVQGDFTNNGTFTSNNRAVFFEGGATQAVNASGGSLSMPYVRVNKSGGTVQLGNTDLTALGPNGGDSVQFTGTTSTLTLNGRTLTLGSTVATASTGSGFVGSASSNLSLQNGGTTGAMGTLVFAGGGQALNNLTINRTGGSGSATLGSNLSVGGALTLTAGDILTGSFTLTQTGTSAGTTDVVGNVRRAGDLGLTARSFGNPNNQIAFTLGTAPDQIVVNLVKSVPTGSMGYPNAVKRTYTITPTGGSGYTATLRLHYEDSDLNGNTEALLDLWRFNGSSWNRVVKTLIDTTNNWVQANNVTQFSPWTLAQGGLLTTSKLLEFKATQYDLWTSLAWQTGYEIDNLGFNVYRESNGRRVLLNSSPIAGSALVAGQGVALTAGNSYSWADYNGGSGARYYLEEIDLSGRTKTYGPFVPERVRGRTSKGGARSPLMSQLDGAAESQAGQRQLTRADAGALTRASTPETVQAAQERQRWLATQPAAKIGVRADGWYRVTREQLTAAGLSPALDPARLQMYEGGVEVPIRLGADGSVEFYGRGLDVQSTDTRVYWLVGGDTAGLRFGGPPVGTVSEDPPDPGGGGVTGEEGGGRTGGGTIVNVVPVGAAGGPDYFDYTVERRDRNVYFSSLQNGEEENFFGRVVNATPGSQTLTARNLLALDSQTARLEVSLQGLTAGEHHVSVSLNGTPLGRLDFEGRVNKTAAFQVEGYLLREGDNQVQLAAGGSGDVSLTDRLRLTYAHSLKADDERLRFEAPAGLVRVGGFTSPNVRVVDLTDPARPFEVSSSAEPDSQGGWRVALNAVGEGRRELFAYADTQVSPPASVRANAPSTWSAGEGRRADMVVVTYGDFTQQVAPLVAQRGAEGMDVKVVDVEDLYDEFSYGVHTPQAVRDFLASAKAVWEKAPDYVLFVGDGSFDPRGYLGRGRYDLVPSKLVDAGSMETASDDWFADFDEDGVADVAVGRLPVRTQAEASTVVGKIVSRTSDPAQTSALMVADRDGPDGYSFESATDGVQALLPGGASVSRINRRAQDASTVRGQIVAGVNSGPLVVNWMGHGSVDVWTGEGLLRGADAASLQNGSRLPLFVMMTCLNGYYEAAELDSLAESVLKAGGGGAYAVWASTGMTEQGAQAAANRELYRILFTEEGVRLGDAARRAKLATEDRDVRRTWVFLGDPSSRLR